MNKNILLLRTLLLSTSQRNIYKYCKDKKKRGKIAGAFIATFFLYALLMGYCILMCIGYGMTGMIDAVPVMCALTISLLAFFFTIFKTNGYLFNFKEYDMLMSLPLEARMVAGCKFLYMYVKSLPWYISISLAMLIGYSAYAHPSVITYPVWVILSLFLPVIPMLIAAFLGFLIARISAGFRKTNIIQTVLMMAFVIFCFSLRFIIESIFKNDRVEATLERTSEITSNAAGIYLPANWFSDAVTGNSVIAMLLLIGVSVLLFTAVFHVVGNSYRSINSALKSHAASKKYKLSGQKKRSLQPAIPFLVYFFIGMVATTAMSPSLEGRNYWIVQSLPIEKKTLYQGKMLFNLYLTVPAMTFATLCMCISAKVPMVNTVLYLILGIALCAFSTAWGCVCGVKHMRLDWENEIEAIKQGAAVALYMLPNMFVVMGLVVLVVILGLRMDHRLLALAFILLATLLAAFSYLRVMSLAKRK